VLKTERVEVFEAVIIIKYDEAFEAELKLNTMRLLTRQ
jgi:hypothetical protein